MIFIDFVIANLFSCWLSNTSTSVIKLYEQKCYFSFEITNTITSLISVGANIGQLVGALFVPILSNRVGRRKTILISSVFSFVIYCLMLIPVHWSYLFVMRIFAGLSCQMIVTVTSPWLVQLCETNKSLLNSFFQLFLTVGLMVNNLMLLALSDVPSRWYLEYLYSIALSALLFVLVLFVKNEGLTETV